MQPKVKHDKSYGGYNAQGSYCSQHEYYKLLTENQSKLLVGAVFCRYVG